MQCARIVLWGIQEVTNTDLPGERTDLFIAIHLSVAREEIQVMDTAQDVFMVCR